MSDRRTAATAAAAADRKSSKPRDSKGAPGAPTTLAAQAVSDGVRAGARYRMRLLAASIVENADALRASGVTWRRMPSSCLPTPQASKPTRAPS
jgi:hypothetical protein